MCYDFRADIALSRDVQRYYKMQILVLIETINFEIALYDLATLPIGRWDLQSE